MFDQIKVGDLLHLVFFLFAQFRLGLGQQINESLSAMNEAWCDAQEAEEGNDQQEKLDALSKEIAKVLCSVAAFGFPMGAIVEQVIREGEALKSPVFED